MKDIYREETNKDVYADYCCERPSASYSDEYVYWLENKAKESASEMQEAVLKVLGDEIELVAMQIEDEKNKELKLHMKVHLTVLIEIKQAIQNIKPQEKSS
jgi:hypothetical protein